MSIVVTARPAEILLVEDNPLDVRLVVEALADVKVRNHLQVVEDGETALALLRREGAHAATPRPDLILLDLGLPRMSGREVLAEIKADPDLRQIPVVVLTASTAERDIVVTYGLQASCYVTKPVDLEQFLLVVQAVEHFWLSIVTLPEQQQVDASGNGTATWRSSTE